MHLSCVFLVVLGITAQPAVPAPPRTCVVTTVCIAPLDPAHRRQCPLGTTLLVARHLALAPARRSVSVGIGVPVVRRRHVLLGSIGRLVEPRRRRTAWIVTQDTYVQVRHGRRQRRVRWATMWRSVDRRRCTVWLAAARRLLSTTVTTARLRREVRR